MDRTSRTHFGMDERGLGGTYMIQQQFLHMYRRIQCAQKQVDNNPPATGMFRRPTYSTFGDYWKRVQPMEFEVESKVDHTPPASFPLLQGLYINQPTAPPTIPKINRKKTQKEHTPALDVSHAVSIDGIDCRDMPDSMRHYLASIHTRRGEVEEELAAIRRRRLLVSDSSDTPSQMISGATEMGGAISVIARDTLISLDAQAFLPKNQPILAEPHEQRDAGDAPQLLASRGSVVFEELVNGSPLQTVNSVHSVLQPLQSLVLRAPETEGEMIARPPTGDRRGSTTYSSLSSRGASMRHHQPLGNTQLGSERSLKSHESPTTSSSKTNLKQISAELLAAAAPKRLVLKPKKHPNRNTSDGAAAAFGSPSPDRDAFSVTRNSPRVPAQPILPRTANRYAVSDSSMAGHHYDTLTVQAHGSAASKAMVVLPSGAQVVPSTKVVGLVLHYHPDEDAATCDDHHA